MTFIFHETAAQPLRHASLDRNLASVSRIVLLHHRYVGRRDNVNARCSTGAGDSRSGNQTDDRHPTTAPRGPPDDVVNTGSVVKSHDGPDNSGSASISGRQDAEASATTSRGRPLIRDKVIVNSIMSASGENFDLMPSSRRDDNSVQPPSTMPSSSNTWLAWEECWGRIWYSYYNWRQDTTSDLQTFMLAFVALFVFNGVIKRFLVDTDPVGDYLVDLYQVVVLSFGESFPDVSAGTIDKFFSVLVAGVGLAAFALILTLVQQVVLEVIEANVRKGGHVYEKNHILIVGWCTSQRDLELVWKSLQQLCLAYRNDGGKPIVVLTQRAKLEMEAYFRRAIPEEKRYGSRLVFRQGSPLLPGDLMQVSANEADGIIVVSDKSRSPDEADAQSLRCAILLDELGCTAIENAERPQNIVIEMTTTNAEPLLRYSCSLNIIPVMTTKLNARRLAKMVRHPVISVVSQQILNFDSNSNFYTQSLPCCAGLRFDALAFRFPDAIILGVVQASGAKKLNPDGDYVVQEGDEVIMIRSTLLSSRDFHAVDAEVCLQAQTQTWVPKEDGASVCRLLPQPTRPPLLSRYEVSEIPSTQAQPETFLVSPDALAESHILHSSHRHEGSSSHSSHHSGRGNGSENGSRQHAGSSSSGSSSTHKSAFVSNSRSTGSSNGRQRSLSIASRACPNNSNYGSAFDSVASFSSGEYNGSIGGSSRSRSNRPLQVAPPGGQMPKALDAKGRPLSRGALPPRLRPTALSQSIDMVQSILVQELSQPVATMEQDGSSGDGGGCSGEDLAFMVPAEYHESDNCPLNLLICGWAEQSFMRNLIRELDHGSNALPAGSHIVFCNTHVAEESLEPALKFLGTQLINCTASHVRADPLKKKELATLDMAQFKCAIVLCDAMWIDPDMDATNGVDELQQMDVLRLDSLLMTVQINVRKILEELRRPTINMVCEKVGNKGLTRFEDRRRLPLGICVNFTSYAAKLLSQVAYNPKVLMSTYDELAEMSIADASLLADEGELLTFWDLVRRAQIKHEVLVGYYRLPGDLVSPLETVINPTRDRDKLRVWNNGDKRLKFLVLTKKGSVRTASSDALLASSPARQAQWVALRSRTRASADSIGTLVSMDDAAMV